MIETFCMRVMKKSRLDGLCPMISSRKLFDLILIRPFLHISKKNIYSYANSNNIKFFEDPTNNDSKFLRTKIRILLKNDQNFKNQLSRCINAFCRLKSLFDNITRNFFFK